MTEFFIKRIQFDKQTWFLTNKQIQLLQKQGLRNQKTLQKKLSFRERQTKPESPTLEPMAKIPEIIKQNKMVSFKSLLLKKVNYFRGGKLEKHVRQRTKMINDQTFCQ